MNDKVSPLEFPEVPVLSLSPSDFAWNERLDINFIIENPKDGSLLVLIPGGKFLAGDPSFEVQRDHGKFGDPSFEVQLPAFYAGITTVTNAQYARFLNEVKPNKTDLEKWIEFNSSCFVREKSDGGYEAYGNKENHPVVEVSWFGSQAYCQWAGGRLPTELEWEKASRFTDGRKYPWGQEWYESLCRKYNGPGTTTSQVFGYAEGVSPWGLYQMSGNVLEWCQDWYDSESYKRYQTGDLTPPSSGDDRVLRGGSWSHHIRDYFRCAKRYNDTPKVRYGSNGFRLFRSLTH